MSNSDTAGAAAAPPAVCGSADQAGLDGTGAATTFLRLTDDEDNDGAGLAAAAATAGLAHASATSSRRRTVCITAQTLSLYLTGYLCWSLFQTWPKPEKENFYR